MPGRPKLFEDATRIHITVDVRDYQLLTGEMLDAYRAKHPGAYFSDFARSILQRTIEEWVEREAERNGAAARRRQQLRKAAEAVVGASDAKVEQHARKLAAMVDQPAA